jgi:hypothetical protein
MFKTFFVKKKRNTSIMEIFDDSSMRDPKKILISKEVSQYIKDGKQEKKLGKDIDDLLVFCD